MSRECLKCLCISSDVLFQDNHLQLGFKTILQAMLSQVCWKFTKSAVVIIYICFLVFRSTTSCLDWDQCVLHLLNPAGTLNLFCSHRCHCRSLLVQLAVRISCRLSEGSRFLSTCIFIPESDVDRGKSVFYHRRRCCHTVGYSEGE